MLTRLPAVRHAVTAAGPGAQVSSEPTPELRSRLQSQPELAAMSDFLAASAEELGTDLIYLRDDAGNCRLQQCRHRRQHRRPAHVRPDVLRAHAR
jgi:hypothetical protein